MARMSAKKSNATPDQRLETPEVNFSEDHGRLGSKDRCLCREWESTMGSVCQLGTSAGSDGCRCLYIELERATGLRYPSLQHDIQMPVQDQEAQGGTSPGGTGVASTSVVADHNGIGMPTSSNHWVEQRAATRPIGESSFASSQRIAPVSHLDVIRNPLKDEGFSDEVVQLFVGSN
ncbi:hypothetical protein OUZ56_005704 [Daphnia magna]|uniref:Uncharacterized protein n=1 Tax=Daphnia magna TaxID=35525 RepID=A0ABQ9YTI4_9CRUS|nr:hypothetical protein OUZ56_005704 [Daphnia magna]